MEFHFQVEEVSLSKRLTLAGIHGGLVRGLYRVGARLRSAIRSRLVKRKGSARPGEPPSIHSPGGLRNILFEVDEQRLSVIAGPSITSPVPDLMEAGGFAAVDEISMDGGVTWRRRRRRTSGPPWAIARRRTARYVPHPFARPALEAVAQEAPRTIQKAVSPSQEV